jgi:hypothetical protein
MKRATRMVGFSGAVLAVLWLPQRWMFGRSSAPARAQASTETAAVRVTHDLIVPARLDLASPTTREAAAIRRTPRQSRHEPAVHPSTQASQPTTPRSTLARWILGSGLYKPSPFPQPKVSEPHEE